MVYYYKIKAAHDSLVYNLYMLGIEHDNLDLMSIQGDKLEVTNICCSGYLGSPMNLGCMSRALDETHSVRYEPELFCGLSLKAFIPEINKSINATVYHTGKFILLGCKDSAYIQQAFDKLLEITQPFTVHIHNAST